MGKKCLTIVGVYTKQSENKKDGTEAWLKYWMQILDMNLDSVCVYGRIISSSSLIFVYM